MPDNPFLEALRRASGNKPPAPTPGPFGAPLAPPPPGLQPPGSAPTRPLVNPFGPAADTVRSWFDAPNRSRLVDLAKLFTKVPMSSGFYNRLIEGDLTQEDQAKATEVLGGPVTPAIREDILHQMTSSVADFIGRANQAGTSFLNRGGQALGAFDAASRGLLTSPATAAMGAGAALGGGLPGLPGAPGGGPGGPPSLPGAPTDTSGNEPVFTQPGNRPDMQLGGQTLLGAPGSTGGVVPQPTQLGGGFSIDRTTEGSTFAPLLRGPDGRILGRATKDANGVIRWTFTADPTDENLQLAAQSGLFDQGDLLKMRGDLSDLAKAGRDAEWTDANNKFNMQAKTIELKLKQGELSLEQAKFELSKAAQETATQKAAVDIAAAKADLALKPLVEQEMRQRITAADITMRQSEERFPYELQKLQEDVLNAQSVRAERERQAARQQAGDAFMGQMMPGLLSALGGKGSAAYAGATPGKPGTATFKPSEAPAPTTQAPAMSAEDNLGPPPVYATLAQNAGTKPDDPAAQMAWGVLQQIFSQQGQPPPEQPGVMPPEQQPALGS